MRLRKPFARAPRLTWAIPLAWMGETPMKTPSAWLALVLLSAFTSAPAFAQDDGLGVGPRGGSVFAEASAGQRRDKADGVIWGGSGGGYFQGHVLGFMARATALPGNANLRVYDAVIGPRLAVSLPFVRLFVEAGGGMGHSGYYNSAGRCSAHRGARRGRWTRASRMAFCRVSTGGSSSWATAISTPARASRRSWRAPD